jgi:hypothetical protein
MIFSPHDIIKGLRGVTKHGHTLYTLNFRDIMNNLGVFVVNI